MEQQDKHDIYVRSETGQNMLAAYLLRAFLQLRDRCNKSGHVRLLGIGKAIPTALLVSQIVRSKVQNAASIIVLSSKQSNKIDQDLTTVEVTIKLNPTEEDKKEPGYQAPLDPDYESKEDYSTDLFDYVMIYVRELYEIKTQRRRPQRANERPKRQERPQQNQQQQEKSKSQQLQSSEKNENRGQIKTRGNTRVVNERNYEQRGRDYQRDDRRDSSRRGDSKGRIEQSRSQRGDNNNERDQYYRGQNQRNSRGAVRGERDDRGGYNDGRQEQQDRQGQSVKRGQDS